VGSSSMMTLRAKAITRPIATACRWPAGNFTEISMAEPGKNVVRVTRPAMKDAAALTASRSRPCPGVMNGEPTVAPDLLSARQGAR
jgi:hypothetical protein